VSTAYVALGSNLGDRAEHLRAALRRLEAAGCRVVAVSSFHDTDPADGAPPPRFLNAAACIETRLEPRALLDLLLRVERELGRERPYAGAPRTIDLDLLLYDDRTIAEPGLVVPHPRMHRRAFVLRPLVEIAPDARHPWLGKSAQELWNELEGEPSSRAGQ
jgi:2-amino-4-hydroxy-6-hydroxymethyldihydropteridine diphosphokinase